MIRELGNVELFELCEIEPKIQYLHCLLHWNQGLVFCNCGQLLVDSASRRKFNKLRLDALFIPEYVIKKGCCHGARHGRIEEQTEYHISWNAWKRCCKRVKSQGKLFSGLHDRFLRDPRLSRITIRIRMDRRKVCAKKWTNLQNKNTRTVSLQRNFIRYQGEWYLALKSQAKMDRCDFDPIFELQTLPRNVSTASQVCKSQNQFLHNNIGVGFLPQAIHGGTRLKRVGGAQKKFLSDLFFVTAGFVYSRWRSPVTDRVCRQIHFTRHFSHAHLTRLILCIPTAWFKTCQGSGVCKRASFHLHANLGVRFVCCTCLRSVFLRVSSLLRLLLLFHTLSVL